MKKSKFFLIVCSLFLLLAAVLVLSACDKNDGPAGECTHQWGEFVTETEPTCKAEGAKVRSCSLCGEKETEKIKKLNHTYTEEVVEPTCTEKGYTQYTCECGASYKDSETAMIAHSYVAGEVKAPTCTAKGYTTYTCQLCNRRIYDDYTDKVDHAYADHEVVTEPTCTERGFTTYYCVCGESKVGNYVRALGHLPGDWQQDEDGSYYSTCQREGCEAKVWGTDGLAYQLQADDTYYVIGIGIAIDKMIVIPGMYEGKPVTGIADGAFIGTEITAVNISDLITFIGEDAFFACSLLEEVRVAASNEKYRFENGCLIEIETNKLILARGGQIPEGVVTIGKHAFSYSSVASVCIPASLTTIEQDAFYRASALVEITAAEGNTVFSVAGNCIMEAATNTLVVGCLGSVIPDTVEVIAPHAFSGVRALTDLKIPTSVVRICEDAFYNCPLVFTERGGIYYVDGWVIACDINVATLTLPGDLVGFADGSLDACTKLTHINYAGTSENWNSIKLFEGWDAEIDIVCTDGILIDGVLTDKDDIKDDPFEAPAA